MSRGPILRALLLVVGLVFAVRTADAQPMPPFTANFCGQGAGLVGTTWLSLPSCSPLKTAEDLCAAIPNAVSVRQGFPMDTGLTVDTETQDWTFDCVTRVCTQSSKTLTAAEPGCDASSCFCVDPGEGVAVVTSAPSSLVIEGCEGPVPIVLPAGARGYLISVPYQTYLVSLNDLALHIGLPVSGPIGAPRGTISSLNCLTGLFTQVTAGTPAAAAPLIRGQAYLVRYTDSLGHMYTNPVLGPCACVDCDDQNVCTDDVFDPVDGCLHTPNSDPCGDGDACTLVDACTGGSCVGSDPVTCAPLDQCHDAGLCDPASGVCSNPEKADGSACDDGNACTAADVCTGGVCTGGPPPIEICNGIDDDCDDLVDEGCPGKVTGGGEIEVPGGESNFGFIAQIKATGEVPSGSLEYYNHARSLNVHSLSILTLAVSGTKATFTGECRKNGVTPCTFSVTVDDNGEPGNHVDRFIITVSDEPIEGDTMPIIKGNIQVHKVPTPMAAGTAAAGAEGTGEAAGVFQEAAGEPGFAAAGGGVYPDGTDLMGVPVRGLRLGSGADVPGPGFAEGVASLTLLGTDAGGGPQPITIETNLSEGYVLGSSAITVSGPATVDMGDGSPPRSGLPFTLTVEPDTNQQMTVTVVVDQETLPAATVTVGGVTLPPCRMPPAIAATLEFRDAEMLSWRASPAAGTYNLYRGTIDGGAWAYEHACLESGLSRPSAVDASLPPEREAFYYLTSIRNACGEGPLGSNSDGRPLPNDLPCP